MINQAASTLLGLQNQNNGDPGCDPRGCHSGGEERRRRTSPGVPGRQKRHGERPADRLHGRRHRRFWALSSTPSTAADEDFGPKHVPAGPWRANADSIDGRTDGPGRSPRSVPDGRLQQQEKPMLRSPRSRRI